MKNQQVRCLFSGSAVGSSGASQATGRKVFAVLAVAGLLAVAFLGSAPVVAQADAPLLTLARYAGEAPDLVLTIDHASGNVQLLDQLRRNPYEVRGRRLPDNLFKLIGRAANQPAIVGEILLAPIFGNDGDVRDALFVETSTGFVAFLDEFGKGGKAGELGSLITAIGRPFGPIAATDGNFALVSRRIGRRTEGAYLLHGTTGKGLYLGGLAKLEVDGRVSPTTDFPKFEGKISAAEIRNDGTTVSYLVADNTSGKVYFLDTVGGAIDRLNVRATNLDLVGGFAAQSYNPSLQRFVLEPLDSGGTTTQVLVLDVASGYVGLIDDVQGTARLRVMQNNLYGAVRPGLGDTPRTLSSVRNGQAGVWFFDSLSGSAYYVENPTSPAGLRIAAVAVLR